IEPLYVLHNNRAVLRVGQKRYAEAVAELREAIELRPGHYQAYASLAEAYAQQQKMDQAVEAFGKAVEAAKQLLLSGELDVGTLALLSRNSARLKLERKDAAGAVEDLRRAIDLEPAGSPARALAYKQLGYALGLLGRWPEALDACNAALAANPNDPETLLRR